MGSIFSMQEYPMVESIETILIASTPNPMSSKIKWKAYAEDQRRQIHHSYHHAPLPVSTRGFLLKKGVVQLEGSLEYVEIGNTKWKLVPVEANELGN